MQLSCPKCGWSSVRVSKPEGALDRAAGLLLLTPLRCRKCRLRYYRPWYMARQAIAMEKPLPVLAPRPVERNRVLLLDDDPALRGLLRRLLDKKGYQVREASDVTGAMTELNGAKMDVAVVNLSAAEEGEKAVRALRSAAAKLAIVVCFEAEGLRDRPENLLILARPSRPLTVVSAVAQALGTAGFQ